MALHHWGRLEAMLDSSFLPQAQLVHSLEAGAHRCQSSCPGGDSFRGNYGRAEETGVPSVVHALLYHMAAEKVEGAAIEKRAQGRTRGKKTVQIKGNEVWICNITATTSPSTSLPANPFGSRQQPGQEVSSSEQRDWSAS